MPFEFHPNDSSRGWPISRKRTEEVFWLYQNEPSPGLLRELISAHSFHGEGNNKVPTFVNTPVAFSNSDELADYIRKHFKSPYYVVGGEYRLSASGELEELILTRLSENGGASAVELSEHIDDPNRFVYVVIGTPHFLVHSPGVKEPAKMGFMIIDSVPFPD